MNLIPFFLKCDLVPDWATKGWLRVLSREYPTLAFHASINKSFGKVFLGNPLVTSYLWNSLCCCCCCCCCWKFVYFCAFSGFSSFCTEAVCTFESWQTSNICGIHWVSQCWKIFSYQHLAYEECNVPSRFFLGVGYGAQSDPLNQWPTNRCLRKE